METRSNTPKKKLIETKDCFVGISVEEKMLADAVSNEQKSELDPVPVSSESDDERCNDSSYDIWTNIFVVFLDIVVTGLFPGWIYSIIHS